MEMYAFAHEEEIPKHSWQYYSETTNTLKNREMVKYTAVFSHNEIPCSKQNEQSNCAQKYKYSQTVNVKETIQKRDSIV